MKESTELLRAVIESAPIALVMIDRAGAIRLVNTEAERLFGHPRGELLGKLVDVLVPERFRGLHPAYRTSYQVAPEARRMGIGRELFAMRKDGSEFPVEIGLNPIHVHDEKYILSAIVDISERKKLEERFRATVESAPTAMVMIDRRGLIVLANSETEKLFGHSREALIGKPVEILIPETYRRAHPSLREGFFDDPRARSMGAGRDLHGVRADGSEFPIQIGLNPIETAEGIFVLSAIVDISERKRAEQAQLRLNEELEQRVLQRTAALEQSNAALERSNEELRQFAYIASHDLQTPLRGIAGCAQLLKEHLGKAIGRTGDDLIARMVSSTVHLQKMIRELLTYSRVDSREYPLDRVDLSLVLGETFAMLDSAIHETGARITCVALPKVIGDHVQLVQLMSNLLGNAIKYRGDKRPEIHIDCREMGEEITVSVEDNGIGISPGHRDKVFDIFRRLHAQETYPGVGIGLAICRRVVERHGGRIWVESAPGNGSRFLFTLKKAA